MILKSLIKNNGKICFIKAFSNGLECWFYLLTNNKSLALLESKINEVVDLKDYGKLMEYGYGRPSDYIRNKMKEEYGIET